MLKSQYQWRGFKGEGSVWKPVQTESRKLYVPAPPRAYTFRNLDIA